MTVYPPTMVLVFSFSISRDILLHNHDITVVIRDKGEKQGLSDNDLIVKFLEKFQRKFNKNLAKLKCCHDRLRKI